MVKIQKARELSLRHGIKCVVYGEAGSGKTSLAKTAPKPLVISAERGLLALADTDIDCIEVSTLDDFSDAFEFVQSDEAKGYWTIILDSVSEIAEVVLSNAKANFTDPRQAYGALIDDVTRLIKEFRDLPKKHVVLIFKEESYLDHDGVRFLRPSTPGKTLPEDIPYLSDLCLRLYVDFDGSRRLQTQPDGRAKAKDRSGRLDPDGEEPNLQAIFDKILKSTK